MIAIINKFWVSNSWKLRCFSLVTDLLEQSTNLVWDDAKANNILIDRSDDTWVIDFEEGWTEHWVHSELANSMKGDLQGLENILRFLEV